MVSVPMELPGDRTPPAPTATREPAPAPIVPLPPSTPPAHVERAAQPAVDRQPAAVDERAAGEAGAIALQVEHALAGLDEIAAAGQHPVRPSVVLAATSKPPDCVTIMARAVSNDVVVASVPPLSASPGGVAQVGVALDLQVPPETVVPPL